MTTSTKARHAVHAMIDLALQGRAGPLALTRISERQGVSLSYMEQLFAKLRRQGLVEATRGPGGGYTLTRKPEQISVADIVDAVDLEPLPSAEGRDAMTAALVAELDAVMRAHMGTISLQSLLTEVPLAEQPVASPKRLAPVAGPAAPPPATRGVRTTAPNSVFAFGLSFAR